ncbi:hypothetical protein ABZ793_06115 [Micromonospora sp. NPDC047465]|uniref:hypothetical protein n=1 Tax=Micromonospora sp. NPDC047465 TaxID=3154813 RepID=UPI0033D3598A
MTATHQKPSPEDTPELPDASLPDVVLQILAKGAQEGGLELGVTLSVSGGLVTGTLVGRDRWFQELGDFIEQAADRPDARSLADELGELMSEVGKPADGEDGFVSTLQYVFIHLINARYVQGSQLMPNQGTMLWRGRISEVAGFSVGTLAAGQ